MHCILFKKCLYMFKVKTCGDPTVNLTTVKQRLVSGIYVKTVVLSSVLVECVGGYFYSDGNLAKNITCQANQFWNFNTVSCSGWSGLLIFVLNVPGICKLLPRG